jgi:hypothetical protein
MLNVIYDHDRFSITIEYSDFLDFILPETEWAQLTLLHLFEDISIIELCKCYQEQLYEET